MAAAATPAMLPAEPADLGGWPSQAGVADPGPTLARPGISPNAAAALRARVELERRQVALVAAAERDGFHASGWATRTVESEESACWASRAMEASSDGTHLETEVRLAIAAARRAAMFERDAAVEALGEARHAAQEVGRTPHPPHLRKLLPLSCGAQPKA